MTAAAVRGALGISESELDNIELAELAQEAESEFCNVRCGIMDQYTSAMGKEGCGLLIHTANLRCNYVPLRFQDAKLVVLDSGVKHSLADSEYNERRRECEKALKKIRSVYPFKNLGNMNVDQFETAKSVLTDDIQRKRVRHVVYENRRTIQSVSTLRVGNIAKFGRLMNESHISLRYDYEVTCPEIDFLVDEAWKIKGVLGSRMTGGGFGGSVINLIHEEAIPDFMEIISAKYREKYGKTAKFFVVEAGDGVHKIEL